MNKTTNMENRTYDPNKNGCNDCKYVTTLCDEFPCCICRHDYDSFSYLPMMWKSVSDDTDWLNPFDVPSKKERVEEPIAKDDVVNPAHYQQGNMETIDEMVLMFGKSAAMDFCKCNAWKYRSRALWKNGEEDMRKSYWYIDKYNELKDGVHCNE